MHAGRLRNVVESENKFQDQYYSKLEPILSRLTLSHAFRRFHKNSSVIIPTKQFLSEYQKLSCYYFCSYRVETVLIIMQHYSARYTQNGSLLKTRSIDMFLYAAFLSILWKAFCQHLHGHLSIASSPHWQSPLHSMITLVIQLRLSGTYYVA